MGPTIARHARTARPPLPLLPLLGWALALLAYPVLFVIRAARFPVELGEGGARWYGAIALEAVPAIVAEGVARLPVAGLALAVWAAALGGGVALVRRLDGGALGPGERAVFGGALGMGVLSLGTFLLGAVGGGALAVGAPLLLVALGLVGLRDLVRAVGQGARALRAWAGEARAAHVVTVALGVLVVGLALTRAHVPVFEDYDSLEYHLGGPARWWRAGQVTFLRDVVYSNFPQNVEMLYLLTMSCFGGPLRGAVVGLQVGVGFAVLTAGAVAACGRRLGWPAAGRAGAALFLATPMLPGLATQDSYVVELPMAAYAFLALHAFLAARGQASEAGGARRRLLVLCGAMAGLAVGCKYTAVLFVAAPLAAFVLAEGWRRGAGAGRALGRAARVGVVAALVASPWLIRNAVNTGNPVYPLLYGVFDGSNWSGAQAAKFAKAHRAQAWSLCEAGRRFWTFAAWRDQPGGEWEPPWRALAAPLVVLFAALPLARGGPRRERPVLYGALLFGAGAALLRFRAGDAGAVAQGAAVVAGAGVLALPACVALVRREGALAWCLGYFVLWFATWYAFTHRVDRFLDPAMPALAVVAGVGVTGMGRQGLRRAGAWLVPAGLGLALVTTLLIHTYSLYFGLTEPPEAYLARRARDGSTYCHAAIHTINQLPQDARVLFVGEARSFYCRRPVLTATVFDRQPIDRILEADGPADPLRRVRDGLRRQGVSHVYVNWPEIQRLGATYAYRYGGRLRNGFSEHVNAERPGLFREMQRAGYLRRVPVRGPEGRIVPPGSGFVLYEVL